MKIAFLGSRGIPASYSGAETFFEQLGVRLAARGHHITVYNRSHHIRFRGSSYHGVHLVRLPSIRTKHLDTITHTFLSLLHALPREFDVYYIFIVGNSPLCALTRVFGKRCVLNVDAADWARDKWGGPARTYLRWTEKVACKLADVIIADARVIQRRYADLYGREALFIPYGANVDPRPARAEPSPVLERFGLEPEEYVLFVSRMTPENGAHLLIQAFKQAHTNLKLVIVGDAPYMDEYKRYVRSLSDERVVLAGYLFGDDYRAISHGCRYFVLPSRIDGTRPVLLDQMGFGNCVVVMNSPANLEVIGDAGISFDQEDAIRSLKQVLERLSTDRAAIEGCRRLALSRVTDCYSWDRVTDQYEALFRDLTGRSSRR